MRSPLSPFLGTTKGVIHIILHCPGKNEARGRTMNTLTHWLTATDLMTPKVLSVQADWPIRWLADFLLQHGISGAPVLNDEGTLVGVVSHTDLVRHEDLAGRDRPHASTPASYYNLLDQYAEEDLSVFRFEETHDTCVRDIMTPSIFQVAPDTPVQDIAETMIRGKIHRLFVTDGRRIVGIITAMDLLKVVRDL